MCISVCIVLLANHKVYISVYGIVGKSQGVYQCVWYCYDITFNYMQLSVHKTFPIGFKVTSWLYYIFALIQLNFDCLLLPTFCQLYYLLTYLKRMMQQLSLPHSVKRMHPTLQSVSHSVHSDLCKTKPRITEDFKKTLMILYTLLSTVGVSFILDHR